ncbi:MAG: aldo/keto reductase [Planctomycetota bacterium]
MLPKVQRGNTGKELSRFGLGGFHQLEITTEQVAEVVSAFLAAGGNYIETARNYGGGASEVKIGRALAGRANDVILASKTSAATADDARADLETSLKTLGRDRHARDRPRDHQGHAKSQKRERRKRLGNHHPTKKTALTTHRRPRRDPTGMGRIRSRVCVEGE